MSFISNLDKFTKTFIDKKIIKNESPKTLYQKLYGPKSPFIRNILDVRNDYNINSSIEEISKNENDEPFLIKYHYDYVHPMEKKIPLGPSKININDEYKIESYNNKLLVEVTNKITGFMLMDSFISRFLYIFERINDDKNETILDVKYGLEFIKANPFKSLVKKNAYSENEEFLTSTYIEELDKMLNKNNNKEISKENINNDSHNYNYFNPIDRIEYWYYSLLL